MSELVRDTKLSWRDYEQLTNLRLNKIRFLSVAVDPASITNATSAETAVTLKGVNVGDMVFACPPASLETGLVYSGCRVSAADTIQLRLSCIAAAPVDGASRTWQFLIFGLDSGQ